MSHTMLQYLHFKFINEILFIKANHLKSWTEILISCLITILLPIISQAIYHFYRVFSKQNTGLKDPELIHINSPSSSPAKHTGADADTMSVNSITNSMDNDNGDNNRVKDDNYYNNVSLKTQIISTLFYMISVSLKYLMMCIVMTMNVTLILCLLIGSGIGLFIVDGLQCRQTVDEADKCGQHLTFFGDPDVLIPTTEEEMDKHCKLMFDAIKCLHQYSRTCLPTFPRQALGIFLYDMKQVINKRCNIPYMRINFLEYAKCWWPRERLHKTNVCVDKHIAQLEYIGKHVDPEFQIPAICCTSHQRHDCIKREISDICDDQNVEYVIEIIDGSTQAMYEFTCEGFTSTKACAKYFNTSIWSPIRDIGNTDDEKLLATRHKHRSVLGPIITIITHFDM
ncbi:uncharacterized protein LOC128956738 [Oppia nitens]|uniref:uncharacterized protein LOC128956738 n=1 Tax=Oppia nitens TaxID=1686743 RepID=UPI0023DBB58E|nr:uncharacterized protein LOC128956738 [Oppia nitens]